MPYFTSKPTDVAYETLMKRVPRFEPDPPECEVIQMDLDNRNRASVMASRAGIN